MAVSFGLCFSAVLSSTGEMKYPQEVYYKWWKSFEQMVFKQLEMTIRVYPVYACQDFDLFSIFIYITHRLCAYIYLNSLDIFIYY